MSMGWGLVSEYGGEYGVRVGAGEGERLGDGDKYPN